MSRTFKSLLAILGTAILTGLSARAATLITNVTVANVGPSGFSLIWQGGGTPGLDIYADAAGSSNLVGQLGVEFYPVHTGNSSLLTAYERRENQAALRANARANGLVHVQVTGCRPGTTYYFRLSATVPNSPVAYHPLVGLAQVTTATRNSVVSNAGQIIIDVPGLNNDGLLVTLRHTNSPYAAAAVVSDGAGHNQVLFNLADLLAQDRQGNFSATGSQDFDVTLLGNGQSQVAQHFTLVLNNAFQIAQTTYTTFGIEFASISLGSTNVRVGQVASIPLNLETSTSVGELLATISLPSSRFTNLVLTNLHASVESTLLSPDSPSTTLLFLTAKPGQPFQGNIRLADIQFQAISNQSSAFVNLNFSDLSLSRLDSTPIDDSFSQGGRIIVLGAEPLLETSRDGSGHPRIVMYGLPWLSYGIEWSPNLVGGPWQLLSRIALTNMTATIQGLDNGSIAFYRAYEFKANPPAVEAFRGTAGSRDLLVFGQPGTQYTLQSSPSLSGVVSWSNVLTYTLTNSFRTLSGLNSNQNAVFYRLQKN